MYSVVNNWLSEAEKLYISGKSYNEIARTLKVNRKTVSIKLRELGYCSNEKYVRVIDPNKLRKYDYSYADTVFNNIETEEQAYWLGFLYADGDVSYRTNTVSLALAEEDISHLISYRSFLHLEDKPFHIKKKTHNAEVYVSYEFSVTSRDYKHALCRLGCVPRKTFDIRFPTSELIADHLLHHFARGYFDGDGCVHLTNKNSLTFDIVGNEEFLSGYQNWIGLPRNELIINKHTTVKSLRYAGFLAILILDRLYENAHVFLQRKYDKYMQLRRLRLMTVRRPKSITAGLSEKDLILSDSRLKALIEESVKLQQCSDG